MAREVNPDPPDAGFDDGFRFEQLLPQCGDFFAGDFANRRANSESSPNPLSIRRTASNPASLTTRPPEKSAVTYCMPSCQNLSCPLAQSAFDI